MSFFKVRMKRSHFPFCIGFPFAEQLVTMIWRLLRGRHELMLAAQLSGRGFFSQRSQRNLRLELRGKLSRLRHWDTSSTSGYPNSTPRPVFGAQYTEQKRKRWPVRGAAVLRPSDAQL